MKLADLFRRTPGLPCQELVELITGYIEGALSATDRRRFEAHLSGCPHCTAYVEQFRAVIATSGRIEAAELSPEARAELVSAFRGWADGSSDG